LLFLRIRSLVRLSQADCSEQQQTCAHDQESMWHLVLPEPIFEG
jgi:hypothetical protein